jgi:methylmalonyl-CoA/ethylmalonyl-CoA epimerase
MSVKKIFKNIHQIGIVTKNVRQTVRKYINNYGIGPWNLWEFGPEIVEDMQVHGRKIDYRMTVATCKKMNVDFEIIEPKDDLSIYYDFLHNRGEGIQHINYDVLDYNIALDFLKARDVKISQFGNLLGKHRYIYFDTENDVEHIIETSGDLPGLKRKESQEIFPVMKGANYFGFSKILQIGVLVSDITSVSQKLNDKYTIGPWKLYDLSFRGEKDKKSINKSSNVIKTAIYKLNDVELVLIEPESNDNILFKDLMKRGSGPYFITFQVDDYEKTLNIFMKKEGEIVLSGNWYGRRFSFLDTRKDLKFITCIIQDTSEFGKPDPYPQR